MNRSRDAEFARYVELNATRLLRFAALLTGDAGAEDLLQSVLEKTYRRWSRVGVADSPDAYVHQALVNSARRQWSLRAAHRETAVGLAPDDRVEGGQHAVDARQSLLQAMNILSRQQQFLGSVFRTATRVSLLFKPLAVARLLDAVKKSLTLDDETSLTDLEKLGQRLRGVGPSKIIFETIPTRDLAVTDTDLGTIDTSIPNVPQLTPKGQERPVGSVQILEQAAFNAMIAKLKGTPQPAPPRQRPSPAPTTSPSMTPTQSPASQTVTPSPSTSPTEVSAASEGNRCTY